MSTLERAIAVAARAHEGQYDKGGAAYILHPLRVMMRVSTPEQRIVAVLHDVIEDTSLTLSDLAREGFPLKILAALLALSRNKGESYQDFVVRLGSDPLARTVKLADLADNSDLSRIPAPGPADLARLARYREASAYLQALA
ncbi:GTP pyrophosphokinase [Pseudomonas sp. MN1F]|uniref:GTP pyrophosphokinase n=1 Tax=Pseudomonas sp. MN1F TaxID=1366632 RepID=UPI00128F60AC|nr:GTP pyrophosphokinase [Pseudomonas sp. MN1F]MQG91085.1 GTP pyrophosphokinase [Pseudomonas sp. MN1F]